MTVGTSGSNSGAGSSPVDYGRVRRDIRNGDVLLYRGRSMYSRVIRWATRSPYSHAGIAAWWNGRLMVMEAVGKGVRVTPLSANVRRYHGGVEWFTCVSDVPDADRQRMIEFAQQELGKEYARWTAIAVGLRILFGSNRGQSDRLRRESRLFCSHFVAQVYNSVGLDLKRGVSDRFMSPADVAASPLLRRVGVLLKGTRQ